MAAGILLGQVWHKRLRPTTHAFRYPMVMLALPVSDLAALEPMLAINRPGLISFYECDHGARDGSSLRLWFAELIRRELGFDPFAEGREVVLYTQPRLFGYVFNPVSFWVCRAADGAVLAVLAEVNNTFGETHSYLLTAPDGGIRDGANLSAAKLLHVSPFNQVVGSYRFRFALSDPARGWLARIDYADEAGPVLETALSGRVEPMRPQALRRLLWQHPLQSFLVILRIHWHALLLGLKRVPFFGKLPSKATSLSRS